MFNSLSTSLINLFKTLPKIQSIYNFETSELEGFPGLTLTPSGNESAYSTTTENRRVYAFMVRLYVERGSGKENEKTCENTMRDFVDSVLDILDKNHSALSPQSQTGYTFLFMHATPSKWGYAGRENEMRVAEIAIRIEFDVDTSALQII